MNDQQRKLYQQNMETDFAFELAQCGALPCERLHLQPRPAAAVVRTVPSTVLDLGRS